MSAQENDTHPLKEITPEVNGNNLQNQGDTDLTSQMPNYENWSLEALKQEVQRLLKEEEIHLIKTHIDEIRYAFNRKYTDEVEAKKEAFLQEGGQEIDFSYTNPVRTAFYQLLDQYKKQRDKYYKDLDAELQANLARKQDIINAIKALISSEDDVQNIYKTFEHLCQQWREIGAVPRSHSEDLWKTYNHHRDRFYEFLGLHRELRDKNFKHNLEEKLKIIEKAETLEKETDVVKAFRELQLLHEVWKGIGSVDKEHQEFIWQKFSNITKNIRDKKQEHFQQIHKKLEENYQNKLHVLQQIEQITQRSITSHKQWQKAIAEVEALRESFINFGRVSEKNADVLWKKLREITRAFNHKKNLFYKDQKKEQQENLEKKRALIEIAQMHKDSEEWEQTIQIMKDIQEQWSQIGHVPYKHSDKMWKDFKQACNHFFDRLYQSKKVHREEEMKVIEQKKNILSMLKDFRLSDDKEKDLIDIQKVTQEWESLENTNVRKGLDIKFYKIIEALYRKLGYDKQQAEILKYNQRVEHLNDDESVCREIVFVERKISEIGGEVLQLENNLQFFGHIDAKNPLLREVIQKIEHKKQALQDWKSRLKELKVLRQSLEKEDN